MEKIKDGDNFDVIWQPESGERMLSIVDNGEGYLICTGRAGTNMNSIYYRRHGKFGSTGRPFSKLGNDAVIRDV